MIVDNTDRIIVIMQLPNTNTLMPETL